jgi:hypothetical protein
MKNYFRGSFMEKRLENTALDTDIHRTVRGLTLCPSLGALAGNDELHQTRCKERDTTCAKRKNQSLKAEITDLHRDEYEDDSFIG